MAVKTVVGQEYICNQCDHSWRRRADFDEDGKLPKHCPHCGTRRWNKPPRSEGLRKDR